MSIPFLQHFNVRALTIRVRYGLLGPKVVGQLPGYDPVEVPPGDPRRNKGYIDLRGCIGSTDAMAKCLEVGVTRYAFFTVLSLCMLVISGLFVVWAPITL